MNKKTDVQHNRIHHLEDTMIMYGVYNSDTLTDLIDTVHRMQKFTTWNEKTFALENCMIGWRYILKMKACAQLCHKFCIISDHSERKICENV